MECPYGVRTDRLIYYCEFGEWKLFDLEEDPVSSKASTTCGLCRMIEELETELERLREHYEVPDEDPV